MTIVTVGALRLGCLYQLMKPFEEEILRIWGKTKIIPAQRVQVPLGSIDPRGKPNHSVSREEDQSHHLTFPLLDAILWNIKRLTVPPYFV